MLDIDRLDATAKDEIKKWARQPCIREGYLPVVDAAYLLAENGYARIDYALSKDAQNEALGLLDALRRSIGETKRLEGYASEDRYVNGERLETYPLVAYRDWAKRTGYGDASYFEERIKREGKTLPNPTPHNPFQYKGESRLDPSTPKAYALGRRKALSVDEFAAFYCGIDIDEIRESNDWETYGTYIKPLVELIEEYAKAIPTEPKHILDDDVPF